MALPNGLNPSVQGSITAQSTSLITAGGLAAPAFAMGPVTTGPGIYFGSGAPTITAPQGSVYFNTTGSSVSTRMYINTTGSTVWTAVTTVG